MDPREKQMSIQTKLKAALEASLQNITDNDGEVETQDGSFRTRSNSAADLAKLIDSAKAAGISLSDTTATKRTVAVRI